MQSTSNLNFQILQTTPYGRLGIITTPHGQFHTPGFFFCATSAALRGITTTQAKAMGTQGILCNTYHLMDESHIIEQLGGLHKFLNWQGPIITDSGGYQIFSLGHGSVAQELKRTQKKTSFLTKISNDEVIFKHIKNGSKQTLSPAKAIQIQKRLGTDLMFVLDECTPYHATKEYIHQSLQLTKRWAELSVQEFYNPTIIHAHYQQNPITSTVSTFNTSTFSTSTIPEQGLYGIVQGSIYKDFRIESIEHLNSLNLFGYGIGGSLGQNRQDMLQILQLCKQHLISTKPVHLLGIGKIQDIVQSIPYNIDTFDCVHPTRLARHAGALVTADQWQLVNDQWREHIVLTNSQYKLDSNPVLRDCECSTCQNYSRGYINHLFSKHEMLGIMLLVDHNVHFMNKLLENARNALITNTYLEFMKQWSR